MPLLSLTGLTHESIKIAQTLKKANAKIIIITSYNLSPLTKYSDILLISSSEETGFRSESLSSRIAQLAIIDCLFTIVMFDNEQKSRESLYKIREIISSTKG